MITKPVKAFALVVGNPAKQIGWVSKAGHRLEFNADGKALCPETNESYNLNDGEVALFD